MQSWAPIAEDGVSFSETADLVVVGLGAAGASAAIDAARSGLDVMVVERA